MQVGLKVGISFFFIYPTSIFLPFSYFAERMWVGKFTGRKMGRKKILIRVLGGGLYAGDKSGSINEGKFVGHDKGMGKASPASKSLRTSRLGGDKGCSYVKFL